MDERLSRATVIERAAALSDEIGLEELTITKLGRALGIAPPGVYRHVADLRDLRGAIARQAAREVAVALSAACAGLSGSESLSGVIATDAAARPPMPVLPIFSRASSRSNNSCSSSPKRWAANSLMSSMARFLLEQGTALLVQSLLRKS